MSQLKEYVERLHEKFIRSNEEHNFHIFLYQKMQMFELRVERTIARHYASLGRRGGGNLLFSKRKSHIYTTVLQQNVRTIVMKHKGLCTFTEIFSLRGNTALFERT